MKLSVFFLLLAVSADFKTDQLKWLQENLSQAGVKATSSGLQYKILREGDLRNYPGLRDTVKIHYRGLNTGGTAFDSSYDRNTPAEFPMTGCIQGLREGIQLQSVGSKYRFFIKAELAYDGKGVGRKIPADSTLIFDVELLAIKPHEIAIAKMEKQHYFSLGKNHEAAVGEAAAVGGNAQLKRINKALLEALKTMAN